MSTNRILRPSASVSDLLLRCQWPFGREVENDSNEASEYGTQFHAVLACRLNPELTFDYTNIPEDVRSHTLQAQAVLETWLQGGNPWGLEFEIVSVEKPLALEIRASAETVGQPLVIRRNVAFDAATHTYETGANEIPGTADLVAETRKGVQKRIVIDHKTGLFGDFTQPKSIPQLMTLALLTDADMVGVLHAPVGFAPEVFAEEITDYEKYLHGERLLRALRRIGDGSMTPGKWCSRCPVRDACPTQVGALLQRTELVVRQVVRLPTLPSEEIDLGKMHRLMTEAEKLFKVARDQMKEDVRNGAVIERDDGKTLRIETRRVERLSKKSILEALGKKAGEAEIERLRSLGCLSESEEEGLYAR